MTEEEIQKLPYRACVGVMMINSEGLAFVGQRLDFKGVAWQMPQGGIDEGEVPQEAALRELWEETGVSPENVEVLAQTSDWVNYELPFDLVPKIWNGKYRGQKQLWFLLKFKGDDSAINIETDHPEFSVWKWMPISELIDNIVPFKRHVYKAVLSEFSEYLK